MRQSILSGKRAMLFLGMAIGIFIGGVVINSGLIWLYIILIWSSLFISFGFLNRETDAEHNQETGR